MFGFCIIKVRKQTYLEGGENMAQSSKLVMVFKNRIGKNVSISIDDPKDDLTEEEIKTAMELIIAKNVFKKNNYTFVEAVGAKVVNTTTDEYDLVL